MSLPFGSGDVHATMAAPALADQSRRSSGSQDHWQWALLGGSGFFGCRRLFALSESGYEYGVEFREKLHRRLQCSLAAPFHIRQALRPLESDAGTDTLATLQLLVSELVTNAVGHSNSPLMEVSVALGNGRVRAEVKDEGGGFEPRSLDEDLSSTKGRGLVLVDRLADHWGVGGSSGTKIWFELGIPGRSGGEESPTTSNPDPRTRRGDAYSGGDYSRSG